jgi:hypothetical protein
MENRSLRINYIKQSEPVDSVAFGVFLTQQLEYVRDVELLLLKGHTVIEYSLDKAIEALSFGNSKKLISSQFHFKVSICEALGLFEGHGKDGLIEQIKKTNEIRNDIAHRLTYNEDDLKHLYKYYPDVVALYKNVPNSEERKRRILYFILTGICGAIMGRLEMKVMINHEYAKYPIEGKIKDMYDALTGQNPPTPDDTDQS